MKKQTTKIKKNILILVFGFIGWIKGQNMIKIIFNVIYRIKVKYYLKVYEVSHCYSFNNDNITY